MSDQGDTEQRQGRGKSGYKATALAVGLPVVALLLIALLVEPFFNVIVFAAILAFLLEPLRAGVESLLGGRKNISAMAITVLGGVLIVVPILFLLWVFFIQAADFAGKATEWIDTGRFEDWLGELRSGTVGSWLETKVTFLPEGWMDIESRLPGYFRNLAQGLLEYGGGFAGGVVLIVSHFFMMMFMLFFLVRDGRSMLRGLRSLSPLSDQEEDRILEHVSQAARAVVVGNLLTALSQGVVGGVGLAIVGLPGLFLGALMGLASLVPVVGTGLVSIPSIIWLAGVGQWVSAIVLGVWVVLLVGPIDNYLRPFFMRGAGAQSTFFVFIAIIGGLAHFGVSGLVFGPLILALVVALLDIYRTEFVSEAGKS